MMTDDTRVTSFGLTRAKREGTTEHLPTGEVWMTSEEQKYLELLRGEAQRGLSWALWLTGISMVCTLINVGVLIWTYF